MSTGLGKGEGVRREIGGQNTLDCCVCVFVHTAGVGVIEEYFLPRSSSEVKQFIAKCPLVSQRVHVTLCIASNSMAGLLFHFAYGKVRIEYPSTPTPTFQVRNDFVERRARSVLE